MHERVKHTEKGNNITLGESKSCERRELGMGAFAMIRGLIVLNDGMGGWKWFGKKSWVVYRLLNSFIYIKLQVLDRTISNQRQPGV